MHSCYGCDHYQNNSCRAGVGLYAQLDLANDCDRWEPRGASSNQELMLAPIECEDIGFIAVGVIGVALDAD